VEALDREAALRVHEAEMVGCVACRLADSRTRVVVGGGNPDAELMIVGEAPGFAEDRGAGPFAGQAGGLLERLLAGIGITAEEVYVTTLLKCRPPGNRDPLAEEIAACEPHLFRQLEFVRPRVVAPLGNFATQLLTGRPHGITAVHGQPQELTLAGVTVTVLPLYHPAVALYTQTALGELEADVALIPGLLGRPDPAPIAVQLTDSHLEPIEPALQLGLF
jgi:DNA polymerase